MEAIPKKEPYREIEYLREQVNVFQQFTEYFFAKIFNNLQDQPLDQRFFYNNAEIRSGIGILREEIRKIVCIITTVYPAHRDELRTFIKDLLQHGEGIQLSAGYLGMYISQLPQTRPIRRDRRYSYLSKVLSEYKITSVVVPDDKRKDAHHHLKREIGGKDGKHNEIMLDRWFHELIHGATDLPEEHAVKESLIRVNSGFSSSHRIDKVIEAKNMLLDILEQVKTIQEQKYALMCSPESYKSILDHLYNKKMSEEKREHWVFSVVDRLNTHPNKDQLEEIMDGYLLRLISLVWEIETPILELVTVLQKHLFETKQIIHMLLQHENTYDRLLLGFVIKYLFSLGVCYVPEVSDILSDEGCSTNVVNFKKQEKTKYTMRVAARNTKYKKYPPDLPTIDRVMFYTKLKDGSKTRLSTATLRKVYNEL